MARAFVFLFVVIEPSMFPEQGVVPFQHVGNGKVVGTFRQAGAALNALGERFESLRHVPACHLRRHPGGEQGVRHAEGDRNSVGTRLAVLAPAAELLSQGVGDGFHRPAVFFAHNVGRFVERGHLVDGFHGVVPGNGQDVRMGPQELEGEGGVADGPSREGLHGDESESLFLGEGKKGLGRACFNKIERKLDGDEIVRGKGRQSCGDAVGRYAYKPDLPLPPGFQGGVEGSAGSNNGLPVFLLDDLVELEEIYIIGFHPLQAELNVLCHAFSVPFFALRGDKDFLPHAGQCRSEFLFASLIGIRCVEKVDSPVIGPFEDPYRILRSEPDYGNASETEF
ncbi:hypothetical protein SDC9_43284 [bioreactor metagenome]|uniref:Uncharacterized protein n=1 Tax=bioreactor metagenome TaxID=1076179 RepID=A0A644W0R9_9ZZZZ